MMTNTHIPSSSLLKAADVAKMLSISQRTLWRLVSAGKFAHPIHVGGSTRWRRVDIEEWINDGCPPPTSDQQ